MQPGLLFLIGLAALLALPAGWSINQLADRLVEDCPADFAPAGEAEVAALDLSHFPRLARLRRPATFIFLALTFGLLAGTIGWEWRLLPGLTYLALFWLIGIIDLEHRIIPNELVLVGGLAALGFSLVPAHPVPFFFAVVGGAAGLVIFGAVYLIGHLLAGPTAGSSTAPVGLGDLKLAALLGLVTGFPAVVGAIFVGAFLAGVLMAVCLVAGLVGRRTYIPYGPFLLCSTAWVYFFSLKGHLA